MPAFFIPNLNNSEAERVYKAFEQEATQIHALKNPKSRLYSIEFEHIRAPYFAEVGKEIQGFPEKNGKVWALIETKQSMYIFMKKRGEVDAPPINVSPKKIVGRLYFDDY